MLRDSGAIAGMRTHETIEVRGSVVVSKQALDEMNRVLEQIEASLKAEPPPTPVYSGLLSDGTKVEFDSFSELADYPNRTSRHLTRLESKLATEKKPEGLARTFSLEVVIGGPTPCVISIDGEQRHSLHARELMQDVVERIRAGYGWMYNGLGEGIIGVLLVGGLLGAPVIWFFGMLFDRDRERTVKHAAEMVKINPTSDATRRAIAEANEPPWNHTLLDVWTCPAFVDG